MQALYRAGRDGIWVFVFRNLVRPVWLSRPEQRADVLVGNPPWIAYRHMSARMKERLREALADYGLWVGGNLATHQDIFALFWARAAERYLKPDGRIAFVLPYAVLNAPVFAALRAGAMKRVEVRITGGWALEKVWPIFGAKSGASTTSTCVLFGRVGIASDPPAQIDRWAGRLPRRDAGEAEAAGRLVHAHTPWPRPRTLVGESPYRSRFRQGATLVSRRFFIVEPDAAGRLGSRTGVPRVRGRAGSLDKRPWTSVEPPAGPVERSFLRQVILGGSIAPFRALETAMGVVPLEGSETLDSEMARARGHRHLAAWLRDAENKWTLHSQKQSDGRPRLTLSQQVNYMGKLEIQATAQLLRVLYTASGTRLSSMVAHEADSIVEHAAYWANVGSIDEAMYLCAIINSRVVLDRVIDLQPHGQQDPRHFDNLVWTLPIPNFDPSDTVHRDLSDAAVRAEKVASLVRLEPSDHFTVKRRAIRTALADDGIAAEIEALVDALLPI